MRHLADISPKQFGFNFHRFGCQGFDARMGIERRKRFIKSNMAIGTNPADKQVYAAFLTDCQFKIGALFFIVFGSAVKNINIGGFGIYVLQKIFVHIALTTLRRIFLKPDKFIHAKNNHIGK